jgi:hypothetical protein
MHLHVRLLIVSYCTATPAPFSNELRGKGGHDFGPAAAVPDKHPRATSRPMPIMAIVSADDEVAHDACHQDPPKRLHASWFIRGSRKKA